MSFFQRNEEAMGEAKARVEKQVSEWGNSADMLYLLPGQTMVRILPPYSERGVFFREIIRHRVKLQNGTFVGACPLAMDDVVCPICDKAQALKDTGDPVQMKFAKDNLKPQTRYLYNTLVYSAPADNQGKSKEFGKVYVMEAGIMTHRQIVSLDTDAMLGWADITNFNNGVNLIIKRSGMGLDTKYEVNAHGGGRSDVLADLAARGIDPQTLAPINLDELYTAPPTDKLNEVVSEMRVGSSPASIPGASFPVPAGSPVPAPTPVPVPVAPAGPVAPPAVPTTASPSPNVVPITPTAAPTSGTAVAAITIAPPVTVSQAPAAPVAAPVEAPVIPAPPTPQDS